MTRTKTILLLVNLFLSFAITAQKKMDVLMIDPESKPKRMVVQCDTTHSTSCDLEFGIAEINYGDDSKVVSDLKYNRNGKLSESTFYIRDSMTTIKTRQGYHWKTGLPGIWSFATYQEGLISELLLERKLDSSETYRYEFQRDEHGNLLEVRGFLDSTLHSCNSIIVNIRSLATNTRKLNSIIESDIVNTENVQTYLFAMGVPERSGEVKCKRIDSVVLETSSDTLIKREFRNGKLKAITKVALNEFAKYYSYDDYRSKYFQSKWNQKITSDSLVYNESKYALLDTLMQLGSRMKFTDGIDDFCVNEELLLGEVGKKETKGEYFYEYDSKSNWIKRVRNFEDGRKQITLRQIEYY